MRRICVAVLLVLVVSGCGAGGGGAIGDLTGLKKAATDAGLDCGSWNRTSTNTGECDRRTVLSYYDEDGVAGDKAEETIATLKTYQLTYSLLVGDHWIINSPDAADLKDDLGGTLFTGP